MPKHVRKKKTKSQRLVDESFEEVTSNEPGAVARTRRKKGPGAARKQMIAIALDKARRRGARIKRK